MMVATELANLLLERADSSAQLRPAQLSSPSHATSQQTIGYVCARARHFSPPPCPPLQESQHCHLVRSSARSSSRLLARLSSRLSAHAEERRGGCLAGLLGVKPRGESRASPAAAAAAACRLRARSASPRPALSLRLLRGAASSYLISRPLSLVCARAVRQLRLAVSHFGGALGRSTPGVCAFTRRCSESRALAAPPARGRLVVLFGLLSLRAAGALCVL